MGAWIYHNHINISDKPLTYDMGAYIYYKDIDENFINEVVGNPMIQCIQIDGIYGSFPDEVYPVIDKILEKREDLTFRIYSVMGEKPFDIHSLKGMKHLHHLIIDCHLRENQNLIDFDVLTKLRFKSLRLNAFDLRDYSFIQNLSGDLESLTVFADTMGGSVKFDCEWLLRYRNLHTLWLGKKAKKNLESIAQIEKLKSLSLRGIKLNSFDFLKKMDLEKFELLWNSNNELSELRDLTSLKEIGLWRINKLENIDFLSELENLEVIKMQDLRHITKLPDLSRLKHLKRLVLDGTGIPINSLDEPYQSMVERYWR